MTDEIAGEPAYALSAAIAARELSCAEVVAAHLDRIQSQQPVYRPLISVRPRGDVMAEAVERDRELARGDYRGWMHGLPHAVKDLAEVAGLPTTFGFFDVPLAPVADQDELFVSRIQAAGAVFVGKTNTPEFGLGSHTYNNIGEPTANAIDPSRSAGGSSGGAAVAVARGMVPVADGSDFMGSLRNPPGWNGVMGLRPTFGRVPTVDGDVFRVDGGVDGPIARNARDLALLLCTMSGADSRAPLSLADDPSVLLAGLDDGVGACRIGWLGDLGGYLATEPGVLATCAAALDQCKAFGSTVAEAAFPSVPGFESVDEFWPAWVTFRSSQVGPWLHDHYADDVLRARMKPEARWEVETFLRLTADDLRSSAVVRSGLFHAFELLFRDFDVLALPTAQVFPFPIDTHWPDVIDGRPMDTYHRWMEVTAPATMAGLSVLALPAGPGPTGLPIGLQIIAPPRAESLLLRFARSWELTA